MKPTASWASASSPTAASAAERGSSRSARCCASVDGSASYLVAFIAVPAGPENQRVGDMAASTRSAEVLVA